MSIHTATSVGGRVHGCEILLIGSDRRGSGCACRYPGAAESYKTLSSGIVYQKPPMIPVQRQLYKALAAFLTETKQPAGHSSLGAFKDSEVFQLLVFLFRMGLMRTNGRPRSRRFIEFLRRQFPGAQEWQKEESRIIVP